MKLLYGFGVNDSDVPVYNEGSVCPFYRRWKAMIERAYSKVPRTSRNKNYSNVSVCEEWKRFSVFKAWMEQQNWQGKELDKDWIGDGTLYSPDTCVFVTSEQNKLLMDSKNSRGLYPLGVTYKQKAKDMVNEYRRPYRAVIRVNGEFINLGSFGSPEEAHRAWQAAKIEAIQSHIKNPSVENALQEAMFKRVAAIQSDMSEGRETLSLT